VGSARRKLQGPGAKLQKLNTNPGQEAARGGDQKSGTQPRTSKTIPKSGADRRGWLNDLGDDSEEVASSSIPNHL